jgi:hypothetical protein
MAGNRDLIFNVKPGDRISADQQNEMAARARADWVAGHGYADSAGTYQYDRVAEKEGVYVVNDSNQVLPAFGVMMAWRLAKATDPTGRNETDVFRINIDGQDTDNPYSITDSLCLLVNGPSDLANERVGIAYPINDYFPRPALYDTDQFGNPSTGDVLGVMVSTWKLGPGLPGFLCAEAGVDSNGCVKVIADRMTRAWWARVHTRTAAGATAISAYAVADQAGDLIYDGVSATPAIDLDISIPPLDPGLIQSPNFSEDAYVMYTIGVSANGLGGTKDPVLVSPGFDDPVKTGKLWPTVDIATIPTGWSSTGTTIGSYTIIARAT